MVAVAGVVFDYPGTRALDDVSCTVASGTITALVGPNGAGKTTLLRCIAALDRPMAGRVTVAGIDVHEQARASHRHMGYLPDTYGQYDELTVQQCLRYRAAAQAIPPDRRAAAIAAAATRMQIADRLQQRAGTLSRGLRQRLAIAEAIIHAPALVLLDEPASGLDPEARLNLSAVLRALRDEGMTLIVSSHILAELEDYATDMLMLRDGLIVEHRPLAAAAGDGYSLVTVMLAAADPRLLEILGAIDGVTGAQVDGATASFTMAGDGAAQHAVLKRLVDAGLPVCGFASDRARLRDAYLARTWGSGTA